MSLTKKPAYQNRLLFTVFVGVVGLAAILFLSVNVVRDLRLLNSASSDNLQWTLSQTEVEFLEFDKQLVTSLGTPAPDLKILRREFDIFYSRVNTLERASIYASLRDAPEFSRHLVVIRTFLDRVAATLDSSDAELIEALPQLEKQAREMRMNVRLLSNSGLNFFANESDRRRTDIGVTLLQMAIGGALLLLALLLLVLYLGHLNNQNIRRRAEVVEASKRMNVVTSTALDAVVVCDVDGHILDFNAAAEQIFGHSAHDAIGKELGALIVPDKYRDAHEAGMARMRANGEKRVVGSGRIQLEAKRSNGEIFPVEFAIQSAETDDGEIFISFLRDISHRKEVEQELVATRDRALAGEKAKTDFLATMSHEIRTPLNGLLGNLTLLQDTRLSAKQMRYITNMETSGKLLMSHISDVLDITKYDAGKLHLFPNAMNISKLLQDIVDNQSGTASSNDTALEWGWVGSPADWINADRDRIQHVLMNVIGNAVKFTRAGRVSVEAEVVGDLPNSPGLRISVRDTGIGMNENLRGQIFDDFMTGDSSYDRDVGGTGLGLGIAQRFTSAMGGTIEVESEEGVGSIFRICFPIEPISAPDTGANVGTKSNSTAASHILLVEDNEINRFVAREMLIAAGHTVTEAQNGKIAVEIAEEQYFDLILMDISMPIMDGRGATRAIRAGNGLCVQTPIVALTANAMPEEQEAFLKDGMNDIVTKPLSRERLVQVIANYASAGQEEPVKQAEAPLAVAVSYLAELRETLGKGALQSLLNRFAAEVDQSVEYFNDYRQHKFEDVASHAHRMSGSAATLGAVYLRASFLEIELAAKAHDIERLERAVLAVPAVWKATRPLIEA